VQAGRYRKAADIFESAIEHSPEDVRQVKELALIYSQVHARLAEDLAKTGDAAGADRESRVALDLANTARRL
jgi:Tfp pilus assembly protein PilF